MNFQTYPPFDASDTFDDIDVTPNPDQTQSVEDFDNLVTVLMSCNVSRSTGNWYDSMPMQPILPVNSSRSELSVFEHTHTDITARELMTPQLNFEQEFFSNGNDLMIGEVDERIEDSTFPWAGQFERTDPQSNMFSCSPVDHFSSQSNSSNVVGIRYQPLVPVQSMPTSAYAFGSVQLADYVSEIQVTSTYNVEQQSIKKPMKKKRNARAAVPPPNPHDVIQWRVDDGNGRQRRPYLHEFLRILLTNRQYEGIARYVDRRNGIFKFYQRETAAQLWGTMKGRNGASRMNYDKFARGIRYYYKTEEICPNPGRFTFRFGPGSGFGSIWTAV